MASLFRRQRYINFPMLLRVIGWLLCIESCFMVLPLIASLCYHEAEWIAFMISIGVTAGCGFGMTCLKPKNREMGKREAFLLTSLTWIILSLFGMIPFMICGTHINVTDAFFETISGFTTTGATVLPSIDGVPKGLLLWRSVTQWIGGMGIILFTLAVVPMLNYTGGMQLFNAEVTGITHDKLRPRVSYTAQSLWMIYSCLTITLIILLTIGDMSFYDAVCHGLSVMSTGGFSTRDLSLGAWDSLYIKIVVVIFMFLGGVNFGLIFKTVNGKWRSAISNDVFKWYLIFILLGFCAFSINALITGTGHSVQDYTIDPLFQTVSLITSTAFMEPDFSSWGPVAIVVLLVFMFTGACAGSTSGGAKIDRILVLFKFLQNEFYRMMHPGSVRTVSVNGKGTTYVLVQKVLGFLFLYIIVIIMGGMLLVIFGLPLQDAFFSALQAISNMGLGTPNTGISGDYSLVSIPAKWTLSLIMLTGRLEIYTVLLLFTPVFWRK